MAGLAPAMQKSHAHPSLIPLCEKANLRDILPERAEALREFLHSFVSHAGIVATNHKQTDGYDDPEVLHRLCDLDYIE